MRKQIFDRLRSGFSECVWQKKVPSQRRADNSLFTGSNSTFISHRVLPEQKGWSFQVGKCERFYHVDRYGVRHFKARGPISWISGEHGGEAKKRLTTIVIVVGGVFAVVYFSNLEVVPYTNRNHFVLLPHSTEILLGETSFNDLKKQFKNKILPPYHPIVVRVSRIAQKTIEAAMEGVRSSELGQLEYSDSHHHHLPGAKTSVFDADPSEIREHADRNVFREDDSAVDDLWIEKSRRDGQGRKGSTAHMQNFKWEIVVVDANVVNAACLPGGKIVVFTGLFKLFHSDEEIATVLAHEVGHAIARHTAEMMTRGLFIGFIELALLATVQLPSVVGPASNLLLRLPFSRKMEMEADHIGLLVMAAAGYDPRVAPSVYLKLGELQKVPEMVQYISTHPSGKKRAEALIKSQTMNEALKIYHSKKGGWNSLGFLMM